MNKKRQVFLADLLEAVIAVLNRYSTINDYVEQKMLERELLSTNQVAEKYCVSRHTVGRMCRSGQLKPIVKHRSYYFDAKDTELFFTQYRKMAFS